MKRILSMFVAGLATLLPVYISIWLIVWLFNMVDNILKPLLEPIIGCAVPGLGFIIIITLIVLLGFISTNYLGHRILGWWENIMQNIPLLGKVYGTIKRITDSLFSSNKSAFRQVALLEFPRPGIYSLGFITNDEFPYINKDTYSIFIPTTPNPTSGWFVVLPREDVTILDISVDQGMEIIISAGMVSNGKSTPSCKGD
ncbi:MAG: DUF502 domain-containing protein [Syntrophomonadaceae bacterium]|jgi:uncharacterized membrane protein|nr:DUF502 domain-containing protein [Syntrophomonadaceae bacterium]